MVIIEKVNGQTTFTDDTGAAYPKPVQQALNVVFSIGDGSTTDDQVFGTTERKKVGDTWPVAVDFAVKKLREDKMPVDPANCTGSVTFLGLVKDQGMECQQIAAVMQMKDVAFPLPPGMAITSSSVVMKLDGLFPSDIKRPRTKQTMSMEANVQAGGKVSGPNGQEKAVTFTMVMKRNAELVITSAAK